jgi:hypothetical protein
MRIAYPLGKRSAHAHPQVQTPKWCYTKIAAGWTSEHCTAENVKFITKNGLQTRVDLPPQSLLHRWRTLEISG